MLRFKKRQAITLRLRGKSYNEIRKILNIPSKGTLSYWFRNFTLTPATRKRLAHNMALAQKRGLLQFNQDRTKSILEENKKIRMDAIKEIGVLSPRELLLIGVALYWGEGTKSENNNSPAVILTNSDPRLIAVYIRFVREVLNVAEEKIKAGIQIHPHINQKSARHFWSKITKLPENRFFIIKQVSRASKFKRPKRSLPYGTISIRVHKRILFHKIKGYIDGLYNNGM
ncbi:MAG: hypothetical protein HYT98_05160 [Candidatus Sungbacteria bacterium]|nr:hypothetical protein [Candidatus Sungbacteria bacterium]